jgi:hypothetical protein
MPYIEITKFEMQIIITALEKEVLSSDLRDTLEWIENRWASGPIYPLSYIDINDVYNIAFENADDPYGNPAEVYTNSYMNWVERVAPDILDGAASACNTQETAVILIRQLLKAALPTFKGKIYRNVDDGLMPKEFKNV